MSDPKAFVIVGHSNWGKSRTLKVLADGSNHQAWVRISNDVPIFMKRQSNDDNPKKLIAFLENVDQATKDAIIIALCPDFTKYPDKTKRILILLIKKYSPYFFVLKRKYSRPETISGREIESLKSYGKVMVFTQQAEDIVRAKAFKQFIKKHLN